MTDPNRPQYLLDRDRDIQTINDSLDLVARRRADYEARLRAETEEQAPTP